ncbi:MAG: hypothetical protein AAF720_14610 [Pseudomonadota bacterium]
MSSDDSSPSVPNIKNKPSDEKSKTSSNDVLERFADKCDRLSVKETRSNKDLEQRSDSIGTQKAIATSNREARLAEALRANLRRRKTSNKTS